MIVKLEDVGEMVGQGELRRGCGDTLCLYVGGVVMLYSVLYCLLVRRSSEEGVAEVWIRKAILEVWMRTFEEVGGGFVCVGKSNLLKNRFNSLVWPFLPSILDTDPLQLIDERKHFTYNYD